MLIVCNDIFTHVYHITVDFTARDCLNIYAKIGYNWSGLGLKCFANFQKILTHPPSIYFSVNWLCMVHSYKTS